jgi:formylglycine-generating enzyme required for sulfatase activity
VTLPPCASGKSCCEARLVPGGSFNRSNDPSYPATVDDFALDVYEVTVGRFRAFVSAGRGTQGNPPAVGDGAHPKIPGSGWISAYSAELVTTTAALKAALTCDPSYATWSDTPGSEQRPIACITWFEAFAFCSWDGGWLATEAEWNYAAAGGSEQRAYPWGDGIESTRASYGCIADGLQAGSCAVSDILAVGSLPLGYGRWGHADLAGNVWEWTLDWFHTPYPLPCDNCAYQATTTGRVLRGGSFFEDATSLSNTYRFPDGYTPSARRGNIGARCARPPS